MKKFKVGDKVRLKQSLIKWYLSDEGQGIFYPPSGELNERDQLDLDINNTTMLCLAMRPATGVVVRINHPDSAAMNYRVEILGVPFNVGAEDLVRVYE